MNIQNITDTSFQARKILTTQRFYRVAGSPKGEMIEVFKLNLAEDRNFVRKCSSILNNRFTRELAGLQRQLKTFFNEFLNASVSSSNDYYLAIKNSETICGGITSTPVGGTLHITQAFSENPKNFYLDNIFYAVLNEAQNSYEGYGINSYNFVNGYGSKIDSSEISGVKRKIKTMHSNTQYNFRKENNVDLEEVLDIKDFETELLS